MRTTQAINAFARSWPEPCSCEARNLMIHLQHKKRLRLGRVLGHFGGLRVDCRVRRASSSCPGHFPNVQRKADGQELQKAGEVWTAPVSKHVASTILSILLLCVPRGSLQGFLKSSAPRCEIGEATGECPKQP